MCFLCCADAACLAKLHQNWGSCATLGLRPLKIGPAGLKIIRPTAIRTNFSDGLGLQKSGLGSIFRLGFRYHFLDLGQVWILSKIQVSLGFGF